MSNELDLDEIEQRAGNVRTWKAVWGPPIPQLCDVDVPALIAEVRQLRSAVRMHTDVRFQVEQILDEALGTEEDDSEGGGLAADVGLLADRLKTAEARVQELEGDRWATVQGIRSTIFGLTGMVEALEGAVADRG